MNTYEKKYPFPECLSGQCHPLEFEKWLERKTRAHLKRDRKRGNTAATRASYKITIYDAVVRSKGLDAYTGKFLRWDLISTYDNDQSKTRGREYKKEFGDLPTVDHVDNGSGAPLLNICAWRVNDAKNDLTLSEFLQVCREVLEFNGK
ncbi:MAG: hypothetical protein HYV35_02760 [Lentisphaerae bacterium]|nr:hypothetical protein [Lentisphaerota bacterium]